MKQEPPEGTHSVRDATLDDVCAIADLEFELNGIRREKTMSFYN